MVADACALAVVVLGLAAIAGWVFDIGLLKGAYAECMPMKFNTAVSMTLSGFALRLRHRSPVSVGLGLGAALVAAFSLAQDRFWPRSWLDPVLVADATRSVPGSPGHMAHLTVACFFLCGAALALAGSRRSGLRWCAEVFVIAAGTIATMSMLGCLIGAQGLFRGSAAISMSFLTAPGVCVLSAGILISIGDGVIHLMARSRGMGQLLWVGFGALTALLISTGSISAMRLRSISADVIERADIERPRADVTREFEIHVLRYAFNVRRFVLGDHGGRGLAVNASARIHRTLDVYRRLIRTPHGRELAARFEAMWEALREYGEKLMVVGEASREELAQLHSLEMQLVEFLDEEMQPDAENAMDKQRGKMIRNLANTEALTLALLIGGTVIALVTSGAVARLVLGGELALTEAEEKVRRSNEDLERRVRQRTAELECAMGELEGFSYSVSHDLRTPLRAVGGFSKILMEDYAGQIDAEGQRLLGVVVKEARRMGQLIDDLLAFSRLNRQAMAPGQIDMAAMARQVSEELAGYEPGRKIRFTIDPLPPAIGTASMINQVWTNLLANAVKFTRGRDVAEIAVGFDRGEGGKTVYTVRDNGAGFDMEYYDKLFGVFARLHGTREFEGTGVGLALVKRIIQRHGGSVWAKGAVGEGATFSFTLPQPHGAWVDRS
jgi:signal transduction histidine kinase